MSRHDPASAPSPRDPQGRGYVHFLIPAVLALLGYIVLYQMDTRMRLARGPWVVTFKKDADGTPSLAISQPNLGVSNVVIRFLGETPPPDLRLPIALAFREPKTAIPFGTNAFDDLMYLPGTVVLHCFGHEVQMLPRALFLNRQEHPWEPMATHNLQAESKLPSLEAPRKTSRLRRPAG